MEVISEKYNELFARKEVIAKMPIETATPPRSEVMKSMQAHFAAAESEIVINKVEHPFGSKFIKIHASIYKTAEGAKKEPKYIGERGKKKEKKPSDGK